MTENVDSSLVGRTVVGLDVSSDQKYLRFRCRDGDVVWQADGDCCSETWWADGYSLNALFGKVVLRVVELELVPVHQNDGRGRQEYDQAYGVCIETTYGSAQIVYRNSSNGYYGGSFSEIPESPEPVEWTEIVGDDWAA